MRNCYTLVLQNSFLSAGVQILKRNALVYMCAYEFTYIEVWPNSLHYDLIKYYLKMYALTII